MLSGRLLSIIHIILTAILLVPFDSIAQRTPPDVSRALQEIERKVEGRRTELGIPGLSLAIVKDGQVIFIKGFGYKDVENKLAVTADTQFAIGSVTKSFTALTVLMAADKGKLDLNDSPKKFLPYFKASDPETDRLITIRDLLDHSSGINRTDLAMLTGKLSRKQLIELLGVAKPKAKLNETFLYNNTLYAAAGEIASIVEKRSWEGLVRENIFGQLGMTNSTVSLGLMQKAADYSFGYDYDPETKKHSRFPFEPAIKPLKAVAPAGSLTSSARDMAKWVNFVLAGGEAGGKRLVSPAGFVEWTKPQNNIAPDGSVAYGLGWFIQDWKGTKGIGHGGNVPGFTSWVAMFPEKQLGFVLLTNVSDSDFGLELTSMIYDGLVGSPATPKPSSSYSFEKEVGKYRFEQARVEVEVKIKDSKLLAIVPGQPIFSLENIGGRKYKILGAPAGVSVTFTDESLILEQPQGNVTMPKISKSESEKKPVPELPAKGLPTIDEVMAKAIVAAGGEANLRKIATRIVTSDFDAVHQGVRGTSVTYSKNSDRSATGTNFTAFGKKIAQSWEYFDGREGEFSSTFSRLERFTGRRLVDARIHSDLLSLLNWKTNFKKAEVKGIEKVGEEDCYVLEFTSDGGTKMTDYYSVATSLLIKRKGIEASNVESNDQPYSTVFSDYRVVDGVKLAFRSVYTTSSFGDVIYDVRSVKHNKKIDDKIFSSKRLSNF